ncbi:MAG: TlpA family protein disulfide reductase [Trueperaceae bacterium]
MKNLLVLTLALFGFIAFAQDSMTKDDAMMHDSMEAMKMIESYPWGSAELINARTGETFKIGDYAGKPIFVEVFATWCPNCQKQLTAVKNAQMNLADVVFIALSVEGDISEEALTKYADDNGFENIILAKATPEMLESLVMDFGADVTNPPSTPHFFINATGEASELITGIEDAAKLSEHISMMAGN